jgi:hypothetical protein
VDLSAVEVRRILDAFAKKNLLDIRISADVRYHLHPGTSILQDRLHAFADAYRRAPAAVIRCVRGLGA